MGDQQPERAQQPGAPEGRLEAAERELDETRAELERVRKSRDALIHAGLGLGAGSAVDRGAGRRSPASRLMVLLLICLALLGVVAVSVSRMRRQPPPDVRVVSGPVRSGPRPAPVVLPRRRLVRPARQAVIPVPHLSWLHRAALAPDGVRAAAGGADGAVVILDLRAGDRVVARIAAHRGMVRDLLFVAGGDLISGGADGRVRRFDPTGRPRRTIRASGAPVRSLAVSSNGRWLAVAADAPRLELYSLAPGEAPAPVVLRGGEGWVRAVTFSPDGRVLASGGEDGKLRLWQVASPSAAPRVLEGHRLWINALAFSPDGKLLASAGFDKRICLWDLSSGERLTRLRGHVRRVRALAFSRRGALLASAGLDRRVVLWDVARRQRHSTLEGHRRQVTSVAFDPHATRFLFTAGGDGAVRLWPLPAPRSPSVTPLPPPGPGELTLRGNTSGQRTRIRVVGDDGEVLEQGRRELAEAMRSGPDDQRTLPDPALVKLLYGVASHFGRHHEVLLISGFRSPRFNRLRTRQSRQVGEKSFHIKGLAIDFRIEGVAITTLHKHVKGLRAGGVGYYPDSNFIHMDTGPVRYWSGN